MADTTATQRTIYADTELKFTLDIQSEGFDMATDDFKVIIKNTKSSIEIPKSEMILTDDDEYIFTVDTGVMGTGEYWVIIYAYVPDEDFDDGIRTEVQKQMLCVVTS